ncbi:hypothetical protein ACER0A_002065 [Haloimpatiens sp. FM7315]|uniref:hypothetical protein n=1 Tax=Haloimpatiens sp. FM7315 TaxID=3298609 RepID=UPI0035A3483E
MGKKIYFENLMALYIAIEKQCMQEEAFKYLDKYAEGENPKNLSFKWEKEDLEDIQKFRQRGLKCKEIAKIYFKSVYSIYGALKRIEKELPKQPK